MTRGAETLGPTEPMEGVVYAPPAQTLKYLKAGVLTRETLADAFRASFTRHASRWALRGPGCDLRYAALDEMTDCIAAALLERGLNPLDRVIFQLRNSPELVLLLIACFKAGLIPVCTLAAHREHEIGYLGELSAARLHVVQGDDPKFDDVAFAHRMRARLPAMRWVVQARGDAREGATTVRELASSITLEAAREKLRSLVLDPFQVALFQLSGGTTGVPKIIPRMHNEYLYNLRATIRAHDYSQDDVLFAPLPMMHNLNMACGYGPMLLAGGTVVIDDSVQTPDMVRTLQEYQPTWLLMGALTGRIQPALESGDLRFTRLRGAICGAGSPALSRLLGVRVRHVFGMTEGVIMFTQPHHPQEVLDTMVGQPVSEFDQVRLFVSGTEQEITEPGIEGECAFSGPYTIHGYYKAEERNRQTFTSTGMYRSGDLMLFHDIDGQRYYQFRGRTKDLVSRGGEKINCEEVETLVLRHPAVADVMVIALPDPDYGERACAVLIARPGGSAPDVSALGAFLQVQGLAKFKWPERVEVLDQFPTTSSGKKSKVLLKELILTRSGSSAKTTRGELAS